MDNNQVSTLKVDGNSYELCDNRVEQLIKQVEDLEKEIFIKFTIDEIPYKAKIGQETWGDWIESDYNHDTITCALCNETTKKFILTRENGSVVSGVCTQCREKEDALLPGIMEEVVVMNEEGIHPEHTVTASESIITNYAYQTW